MMPIPSAGHIAFVVIDDGSTIEFYRRGCDIYRAPISSPVMSDGYRCGRWEGPDRAQTWQYLARVFEVTVEAATCST